MSLSFPTNPTIGQVYQGWTWNGQAWTSNSGFAVNSVMLGMQVFTASGTYTPNPAMVAAMIECVGGGGGGAGTGGSSTSYLASGGGGSGGYSRKFVTSAQIGASQAVTIGAGGSGGAAGNNVGGVGGDTSVGALCVAKGARAPANFANPGLGGLPGTGDIVAGGNPGGGASNIVSTSGGTGVSNGASSIFGGGAVASQYNVSAAGNNATNYGSGGSGATAANTATAYAGGNGSSGVVIITEYGSGQGPAGPPGPAGTLPFNYLGGLTLANNGTTLLNISTGSASSDDNTVLMSLAAAFTKNCNAAWSVGNNGGALDSGSVIPAAAWLHVFVIERTDTSVVDVLVSQSATAPTMPSNYTKKRRIGSIKTASSAILAFTQLGDQFLWGTPIVEASNISVPTTAALLGLGGVPSGVKVIAMISVELVASVVGGGAMFQINSPDQPISAANVPISTAQLFSQVANNGLGGDFSIRTNVSGQVSTIGLLAGGTATYYAATKGWYDIRGK